MKLMLGLPQLSRGPLLDAALRLKAPVMISASALARWSDDGPVTPGWEFTPLERTIRAARGDTRPPSEAQRKRRLRTWNGWNTRALDRVADLDLDLTIDSAGFVAMSAWGGHVWTPESYVLGLCVHPAITRFSAMDLCVEHEVAGTREEALERIAKTINLVRRCASLAREAGISERMMPVIQGVTPEDYVRCFDALSGVVGADAVVGVGSMCRRDTHGPNGVIAVMEALHRALPQDVRLHLYGVKTDGAEAASAFDGRVASVDSQAYGVRARHLAQERRRDDPSFSKTNVFTADVMSDWYRRQSARLAAPKSFVVQRGLALDGGDAPRTVLDALERAARAEFNDLIESGALDHDQIVGGRMLEESVMEMAAELPQGVAPGDLWSGRRQLPTHLLEAAWLPDAMRA